MINLEKKAYDLTDLMLQVKFVLSVIWTPENNLQTSLNYQETKLSHNI